MFAKLADHTYVQCGNGGKKWSCWGGNNGGRVLRSGTGSTRRADCIAQPDEKANIRCYLINGVCHQAANRILLPAGILVRGARGYTVSHALFGTYGRVGYWPCSSPFEQCPDVTGDLPECVTAPAGPTGASTTPDQSDQQFILRELEIYSGAATMMQSGAAAAEAMDFHLELFMHMAEFNLGTKLDPPLASKLREVRGQIESERGEPEEAFKNEEMEAKEFVDRFNDLTIRFQTEMANVMKPDQYESLFELKPDEQVILADPEIVKRVYGV
jgi:hypothetical protein